MVRAGIGLPNVGEYADVRLLAALAQEAERAGWDGFFIWDHLIYWDPSTPVVDPWVALTAVALETQRVRLGVLVSAVARRRPWLLARQAATIDVLSGGRLVFGAGLGSMPDEYARFGEDPSDRVRAAKLDEGLDVIAGLWSGEPLSHKGMHFRVDEVTMLPRPVQRPRIPIWIGGKWPHRGPFRRAARWDGVMPTHVDYGHGQTMPPEEFAEVVGFVNTHRESLAAFDVVLEGESAPGRRGWGTVAPYTDAGLTWWVEKLGWWRGTRAMTETRIKEGPPVN
jgi:alkanesulfonate monooxygenase SsuD/methylene tetrahydromethanopterin reductase-like flavin-dependent oxidoreductase (luciferase family)